MDEPRNIIDDPPEYLESRWPAKIAYFVILGLTALAIFYFVRP